MIIMPVKEGENIERALQYYTKPSVAKLEALQHAIYVEHNYRDED